MQCLPCFRSKARAAEMQPPVMSGLSKVIQNNGRLLDGQGWRCRRCRSEVATSLSSRKGRVDAAQQVEAVTTAKANLNVKSTLSQTEAVSEDSSCDAYAEMKRERFGRRVVKS